MHIAQLLANWTCAFEREPLAQASQAVLMALQQRGWQVPVALPEAHHHVSLRVQLCLARPVDALCTSTASCGGWNSAAFGWVQIAMLG